MEAHFEDRFSVFFEQVKIVGGADCNEGNAFVAAGGLAPQ